jgi:hypothetical protein
MEQDTVIICDVNAEEMIDAISSKLLDGAEAKSDLEKMVEKLCIIGLDNLEAYVKYRNKIIKYIQSFYV